MKIMILLLAVAGSFAQAQPVSVAKDVAKDMYEVGEVTEAQVRENAKRFQYEIIVDNALRAFRFKNGMADEKLSWEPGETTPASIRAAADETLVTYYINVNKNPCKLTMRKYESYSENCGLMFCYAPQEPYAAGDIKAHLNKSGGRFVSISGSCRDQRTLQTSNMTSASSGDDKKAEQLPMDQVIKFLRTGLLN